MRLTSTIATSLTAWLESSPAVADPPAPPPPPPPSASHASADQATPSRPTPPPSSTAPLPALLPPGAVEPSCAGAPGDHGRSGMLELGGSFGLLIASGVRDVAVAASVGRFIADNVELSAVASVSNVKAADQSATVWSTLVEPSYHLPLGRTTTGVLGMGVGAAYEHTLGTGLAVAPRIGASFVVGRSGVVTLALAYEYITHSAMESRTEAALIAVTSALRVHIGYAVRW